MTVEELEKRIGTLEQILCFVVELSKRNLEGRAVYDFEEMLRSLGKTGEIYGNSQLDNLQTVNKLKDLSTAQYTKMCDEFMIAPKVTEDISEAQFETLKQNNLHYFNN